jgi:hypothetical protein
LLERVEWIAGTGILLDAEPLATGGFGGRDDLLPIEIAVADFRERWMVFGIHGVIFDMQNW